MSCKALDTAVALAIYLARATIAECPREDLKLRGALA